MSGKAISVEMLPDDVAFIEKPVSRDALATVIGEDGVRG